MATISVVKKWKHLPQVVILVDEEQAVITMDSIDFIDCLLASVGRVSTIMREKTLREKVLAGFEDTVREMKKAATKEPEFLAQLAKV